MWAWRRQALLAALLALPTAYALGGSALLFMVEEPNAGMLHAPQKTIYDDSMGLEELREIHHRVMGRTPRAFDHPLPHVDYFERPQGNLVFMVEGLTGGWHTTYVNQLHREHFHCRVQGVDGLSDVASVYTAAGHEDLPPSRHVCVSGNSLLLNKGVCSQARQVDAAKAPLDEDMLQSFDEDMKLFQPALYPADAYFMSEVQSILLLPLTLNEDKSSAADTFLVFSDALKKLEVTYGRGSQKFAAGRRVLDKAMRTAVQELSSRKLLSQIVLLEEAWVNPSARRQLAAETQTKNVTMEDMASVNIITWTAVGLVLVLLMTMTVLLAADSGPKDSLLYARFQADVSGGKND